jgi:pyrroline-5-carboxylate reductase
MAAAMARGWAAAGADGPESMLFSDSGSGHAAELAAEIGGEAVEDNAALAERADAVVLAMKPAQLDEVAAELAPAAKPVVSVLGATALERLQAALPGAAVVRVMPNIAVEVRSALSACCRRSARRSSSTTG